MSHSILLTGDIEAITELRLRKENAEDIAAEFLFVPHHGSSTSSTPEFISAVRPRYALVSTGYHNRFGFPHPDIVARYGGEEFAILLPDTDKKGVEAVSEKMRRNVEESRFKVPETDITTSVTISVGVSVFKGNRREFFNAADRALYISKSEGKNRVHHAVTA